jgi:hypothetical protein
MFASQTDRLKKIGKKSTKHRSTLQAIAAAGEAVGILANEMSIAADAKTAGA